MYKQEEMEKMFELINSKNNILYNGNKTFLGDFIKETFPYSLVFIIGNEADFFKNKEDNTAYTVFFNKEIVSASPSRLIPMMKPQFGRLNIELTIVDIDSNINNKELYLAISKLAVMGFQFILLYDGIIDKEMKSLLEDFVVFKKRGV